MGPTDRQKMPETGGEGGGLGWVIKGRASCALQSRGRGGFGADRHGPHVTASPFCLFQNLLQHDGG